QASVYHELALRIMTRTLVRRTVNLNNGAVSLQEVDSYEHLTCSADKLEHTYGPSFQLLLIGAVQVAWYLADMAQALDYEVEICDPRAELVANAPRVKARVIRAMPDDWLRGKTIDQSTAVIALCHDPRIDDLALLEVLPRDA